MLGTFGTSLGQSCDIIPVSGQTYVAGFCIELINECVELPAPTAGEPGLPGDCFVAKGDPTPPSIG